MKRGEIWTAAGGADYAGKPRPVIVLQDDRFRHTASVTVCPLTTNPTDAPLIRLPIEPDHANGLSERSRAMVDKLTTVPRGKLGRKLGVLTREDLVRLERSVVVFLGLAR